MKRRCLSSLLPKNSADSEVSSAEGVINLQDFNCTPGTEEADSRFRIRERELALLEKLAEKKAIEELALDRWILNTLSAPSILSLSGVFDSNSKEFVKSFQCIQVLF